MRIQSNTTCNLGYTINGKRVVIPAGALLELKDSDYPDARKVLTPAVKKGTLQFVKAPALPPEEQAALDKQELDAAKALIAKAEKAAKDKAAKDKAAKDKDK